MSAHAEDQRQEFDVVVVGSGSGGATAAQMCARAGRRVAIIDSRPFGGTCALRGCDPKRVLIGAAELVDWNERFRDKGIVRGTVGIDWPALMQFKRSFTEPVPANRERGFRELGIATFHDRARFVDRATLQVGSALLTARAVVIAAGAKHRTLGIPGEDLLATSTHFLDLERLPARIVFVGGGYVSFELAHLAARAGARVQIVHSGSRPLPQFEPDLVDRLVAATRNLGIDVHLDASVEGLERAGDDIRVRLHGGRTLVGDLAVHGAGRVPEIDDLDLGAAGVARTPKGVAVNAYLQSTTNPVVYAAGDAADGGGAPLTPVAGIEGEIVADNLLNGNRRSVDFSGLASIVYTIPPLGSAGLTERQAREQGYDVDVNASETTSWFSSARLATRSSAYKTVLEKGTGRILGASVFGPHAEELLDLFALAIRTRFPAPALREVLFAYPTAASDLDYLTGF